MEEQLFIERARLDKLISYVVADTENQLEEKEDSEEEMVEIRNDMSWQSQRTRMMNRARLEYEKRKKES